MHIRSYLLQLVVVVQLEVLKLEPVDIVAMFVENGGGSNQDVGADVERNILVRFVFLRLL